MVDNCLNSNARRGNDDLSRCRCLFDSAIVYTWNRPIVSEARRKNRTLIKLGERIGHKRGRDSICMVPRNVLPSGLRRLGDGAEAAVSLAIIVVPIWLLHNVVRSVNVLRAKPMRKGEAMKRSSILQKLRQWLLAATKEATFALSVESAIMLTRPRA